MLPRRRLYWLAALVLVQVGVVPAALAVVRHYHYFREHRAGREQLLQLQHRRPADVDPQAWDWATGWAVTAYCNVCFAPGYVSSEELRRFNADVAERLRGPVDLATVDWVWHRLGCTGPHGLSYRLRFEPQYREGLATTRDRR